MQVSKTTSIALILGLTIFSPKANATDLPSTIKLSNVFL